MSTKTKVIILTIVVAIPAFILGPVIWPPTGEMAPTSAQLPFFIALSALEAITFGLGISFLFFGWPLTKKVEKGNETRAMFLYVAIAWMMISWWPHDNMHINNGMNMQGLLYIEYMFHFTLILASFILASSFFQFIKHYHPSTLR